MRKRLIVFMVICLAISYSTCAIGLRGGLLASTVGMAHANLLIDQYNEANAGRSALQPLSIAWGGELEMTFKELMRITPLVGCRGLFTSSSTEGASVSSSLIGVYAGGAFRFGAWEVSADVGAYRGTFSFPEARYEELSGWGLGAAGKASYSLQLTSMLSASLAVGLQWVPVPQLNDTEGGVYVPREGHFLDYSGFGLVIGLKWSGR